jgi:hypothetical protein
MSRDPRPEASDRVGLRFELSKADRDRLLIAAAKGGKSMASYLRELVIKHLDEVEPRIPEPKARPKRRPKTKPE